MEGDCPDEDPDEPAVARTSLSRAQTMQLEMTAPFASKPLMDASSRKALGHLGASGRSEA
ncbi:hypothetical protein B5X24_HaOG202073 [Helicoverpa armigera]|uniref:Uncharacterized protein n=1 Tax=Helicoverpa armigera TaxID=29058 RepID=A0A2W1BZ36_HELAM|nr:hypothetical protein B5X24_HaOG202073 [Helicoverpa armigera]